MPPHFQEGDKASIVCSPRPYPGVLRIFSRRYFYPLRPEYACREKRYLLPVGCGYGTPRGAPGVHSYDSTLPIPFLWLPLQRFPVDRHTPHGSDPDRKKHSPIGPVPDLPAHRQRKRKPGGGDIGPVRLYLPLPVVRFYPSPWRWQIPWPSFPRVPAPLACAWMPREHQSPAGEHAPPDPGLEPGMCPRQKL